MRLLLGKTPAAVRLALGAFLVGGSLLTARPADAQTITTTQAAWYQDDGQNLIYGGNYVAGYNNGHTYRDYFTFDLTGLTGTSFSGATLNVFEPIFDPNFPFSTGDGISQALTFTLDSVSTDPTAVDTTSSSTAIYNDLASGTSYGSYALDPSQNGMALRLSLNEAALQDIVSHEGKLFTLGGYVSVGNGETFGSTSTFAPETVPTLTLIPASVPEASTTVSFGALLVFGLGGLVAAKRRKASA